MIYGRLPLPKARRSTTRRTPPARDGLFTARFLAGLGAAVGLCVVIFLGTALYFTEQNYEMFKLIAFETKPSLINHLEREIVWLRLFFVMGTLATVGVTIFYGRRLIRSLIAPMEKMEDHLMTLLRGDWWVPPPQLPGVESHRGFFLTYDLFHRSLKDKAHAELFMLEKIVVDPANREAYNSWKVLVDSYRARLGVQAEITAVNGSSASPAEAATSRRVS